MSGSPYPTDHEILHEFVVRPDPVLHPTELVESLGMTRQGIYNRLGDLVEEGALDSKKVAGTRIFWLTDCGHQMYFAEQDREGTAQS